ncbi:DUF541 domain-containing protein [Candidatus Nomurabacteria bacterium]|nr:DUF541 domain-containing protein [Candidatus Nomurabacteria bacterium]
MIPNEYIKNLYRASLVFLVVISLFFVVKILINFKSYSILGGSATHTITLSGHGEVQAVPDIANVYFTINKIAKTAAEAQDKVAVIEKKALDFLKTKGVADKDIKTENASVYPKYDYVRTLCPAVINDSPDISYGCGNSKQVLTGYEANESITVKIRKIDDAGTIMQGLGGAGVSNLNGPNFAIDKEDVLKAQARKEAINDARNKAESLAQDLGVSLGRISNFSEGGDYSPMYYGKATMMAVDSKATSSPAELPKGENTITSDVTITYEIK